jgi:hypothetical protein
MPLSFSLGFPTEGAPQPGTWQYAQALCAMVPKIRKALKAHGIGAAKTSSTMIRGYRTVDQVGINLHCGDELEQERYFHQEMERWFRTNAVSRQQRGRPTSIPKPVRQHPTKIIVDMTVGGGFRASAAADQRGREWPVIVAEIMAGLGLVSASRAMGTVGTYSEWRLP